MSLALLKLLFTLDLEHAIKRLLLVFLAYRACTHCGRVYASTSTMAKACNTTQAYIKQILRELIEAKIVAKTGERGPKGVTVYWLPGVRPSIPDEIEPVCLDAPGECVYTHPIDKVFRDKKEKKEKAVSLSSLEDEKAKARFLIRNGVTPGSRVWRELMSTNGDNPHD